MERYEAAAPDVVFEDIEGELLVINLDTGVYFRGDAAAACAWQAVTGGAALSQFDVASQPAVKAFVAELLGNGLIRPLENDRMDTGSAGAIVLPDGQLRLERFDDLADMLALDPVHDVDAERGWPVRK